MKKLVIDISLCSLCTGCMEVAPSVFRMNAAGYIEVIERDEYPLDEVNEAIKYCPEDCIYWEEDEC